MFKAALRSLFAHKLRLSLTAFTIVLGVAFVSGTFIFTDSLQSAFDSLFDQKQPDAVVSAHTNFSSSARAGGQPTAANDSLPDRLQTQITAIPGVASSTPEVTVDNVLVLGTDGKVVGSQGSRAVGRSWVANPLINNLSLTKGVLPAGTGEVALLDSTATQAGASIGSVVAIVTPTGTVRPRVTGLLSRSVSGTLGGTVVVFDLPAAQKLLVSANRVSNFLVLADAGVTQDQLAARLKASLATSVVGGVDVQTGAQRTDELANRIKTGFGFFNTFLLTFGLIALFVAAFLIVNTFSMLVAQRTRELALLRAIGATRRQVQLSVILEAAAVGVIAATIGLAGGVAVSRLLTFLLDRLGVSLPSTPLVLAPRTIIFGYVVGLLVTVLSAWGPARRASIIPPVAALRADVSLPAASLRSRRVVGVVLAVLALVLANRALHVVDDANRSAVLIGVSALAALIAAIALAPAMARPLVKALGRPLPRRPVTRLAVENGRRNPRRTGATASALAIGLALMSAVGVINASAKASVASIVDNTIGADFVVLGERFQPFAHQVYRSIADTPGTSAVTYVRQIPVQIKGERALMTGVDPQLLPQVVNLQMVTGSIADLALGETIVDQKRATSLGLRVGQELSATYLNGTGTLRLVGIYKDAGAYQGYLVTHAQLTANGSRELDTAIYIRVAPGADPAAVRASLEKSLASSGAIRLQNQSDIKTEINSQFDALFGFVYALLALAVIVAFLGIVNTLLLGVYERTRELGLLRAVGTSRKQMRRMVVLEAVLIAIFGALVGLVLGIAYGALLRKALEPQGITELAIPWGQVAFFVILAVVGGAVAALWPAIRASRLNILAAISTE